MSVRDYNKQVVLSSGLTGNVILTLDYDDFKNYTGCCDYLYSKMYELICAEEGCICRVGYKGNTL